MDNKPVTSKSDNLPFEDMKITLIDKSSQSILEKMQDDLKFEKFLYKCKYLINFFKNDYEYVLKKNSTFNCFYILQQKNIRQKVKIIHFIF